ncbi:glycoside hydrolase family 65 protein [Croceibacter atlanticus]|jgi:maltose phosphorylase|uniref:Trehalose/maltose hydrolase (Phosphorylase) n=1 Tax=Croceibacter atlanticus (strain ATCC BAA-628 / JCM 21780 / CIP 108009 / IAM 15332 / KCTC 12090 / HTCC2559) TaxID=216432 RepID=A3U789_CROAH|nr:glycoside hydrolase family 65 protein [Croceibacter atlanticus]EAP88106.1 Trehalose/maltose hydrolase (phosphorylase) [Croceibacter atlanticus HTCC2559]
MNQEYITANAWSIIEDDFDKGRVKSSESLFSLGNGAMGQRANFEETYTGDTFQGSYIAGVYYPDKTRVGWWKNGYPEYFAKVLNAPNWIGINVTVNGVALDLNTCKSITNYKRELNMKEGWYERSFTAILPNDVEVNVSAKRFLSLTHDELGVINYKVTPVNTKAVIEFSPYIDAGITNEDTNWDDKFWDILSVTEADQQGFISSKTMKTEFHVGTYMQSLVFVDGQKQNLKPSVTQSDSELYYKYTLNVNKGEEASIQKFAGYVTDMNHKTSQLIDAAKTVLKESINLGYETLLKQQKDAWASIWDMADITIDGDVKAQQGIRFNIFQLNQTYLGKDERLNIGPKGFTGEKYGGSTYWDTEAYCIPFYMATKDQNVARSLLAYRYNHLDKAIENAEKLGFTNGAALYPMVTMNGEESHNEWEITFEEIHRNGAMVYAIYNYVRYTGDFSYIPEMGLEVMIAISRFWYQRFNYSQEKNKYVMLGVTGPNEYENNVNNNWYTNYFAKWCIEYTMLCLDKVKDGYSDDYNRIVGHTKLNDSELDKWQELVNNVYLPYSGKYDVYLQQDNFLDKELIPVSELDKTQRPINQKWSWDRILRSCYIKQADVLQGFYFFEDHFTEEELERHFDFYEPLTVHESSLSPCVHSIQAAKLNRMDQAYTFYLRTSRLDLDDYNKEVEEGCHITSMAGTWMSIVEGFGGMRVVNDTLSFEPRIPKEWDAYSFKVNFRNQVVKVNVSQKGSTFEVEGNSTLSIILNGEALKISPSQPVKA